MQEGWDWRMVRRVRAVRQLDSCPERDSRPFPLVRRVSLLGCTRFGSPGIFASVHRLTAVRHEGEGVRCATRYSAESVHYR